MKLLPVSSDAEWESLVESRPDATLFHTMPWLRFQASLPGFTLAPLVVHHQGSKVGLFQLFVAKRGIFRTAASPRGIDYLTLGPLVACELLADLLDCYEDWADGQGIDYTSIAFKKEIDADVAVGRG